MEKYEISDITIIVPVYKVEQYIDRCLNSILNQTFRNFEVVLIDDGSPDHCGEICDSYIDVFDKSGIKCIVIHQENGGLSSARNTGIEWVKKNSNSKWITFIDSDDWIHSRYLELLFTATKITGAEISVGMYDLVKEQIVDPSYSKKVIRTITPEELWTSHRTNATVAWGKLYKLSLFDSINYPTGRWHEDEFVTYKLLFCCKEIALIPEPIYHYFINDNSITSLNYMKRFPDLLCALNEHLCYFETSEYQNAYRLEVETYAGALSDAIWLSPKEHHNRKAIVPIRVELKKFLSNHKHQIPVHRRKDIYIAAYPVQKWFIRAYGVLFKIVEKYIKR